MKNTILKIEQLAKKYYPIIKNLSVIREGSIQRVENKLHSEKEEEKVENYHMKNADDCN